MVGLLQSPSNDSFLIALNVPIRNVFLELNKIAFFLRHKCFKAGKHIFTHFYRLTDHKFDSMRFQSMVTVERRMFRKKSSY